MLETSDNLEVVKLIRAHAAKVQEFVAAGPQASEILVEPFVPAEPRRRIRELFARTRGDETVVESSTAERLE